LRMYKAARQRAYPANREVLKKLLTLRHELAELLDYDNFADYITADKMIGSARNAGDFIDRIHQVVMPRSQQDYAVLLQRLRKIDPSATQVNDWQKIYLENLIKNDVYTLDSQEVRRYFSYPKVRQGIFDLVENLFQVSIKPWQTQVWHPSVEAYEIWDGEQRIGQFYLDMHPREGKYQHAAQFGLRDGVAGVQLPLAALVCNFPGGDGGVALLEHDQVETFLHEFGHLLHSMFGGQLPWVSLAGTNVQRDFVEAPSMMLEEWVWDKDTLQTFASDVDGKVIPEDLVTRMNTARQFGKGVFIRQQLFYAALSLNYYNRDPGTLDLDVTMMELQKRYSPFAYVEDTFFYTSFGHLDNYSAIYYTYMWSLALATDMFGEFQRAGLRDPVVAKRYRDAVLAPGASKPAAQLVEDFLGRPFSLDTFAKSLETN
jgi:thimet oligopeptidase